MAFTRTNSKRVHEVLHQIGQERHRSIPLDQMITTLKNEGFTVVQEDGTEWSGFLCGREGRAFMELREDATMKNIKQCLQVIWYKLESGNYEVTAYIL